MVEAYVAAKMSAFKEDRYGGWLGGLRWAKDKLLGMPEKVNAFYVAGRELYLKHHFEGQEIDIDYADKTLRYVYHLWRRPVHLQTVLSDKPVLLSYDGERNSRRPL